MVLGKLVKHMQSNDIGHVPHIPKEKLAQDESKT